MAEQETSSTLQEFPGVFEFPTISVSGEITEGSQTKDQQGQPIPHRITTKVQITFQPRHFPGGVEQVRGIAAALHRGVGNDLRMEIAIRRYEAIMGPQSCTVPHPGRAHDPFLPAAFGGPVEHWIGANYDFVEQAADNGEVPF